MIIFGRSCDLILYAFFFKGYRIFLLFLLKAQLIGAEYSQTGKTILFLFFFNNFDALIKSLVLINGEQGVKLHTSLNLIFLFK